MGVMTTIALVGLGMQAYGMVRGARAEKKAGDAAQRAANSQAELFDFNASVAEQQAADAVERGHDEEGRFRSSVRAMIASQRTGFAGQGVEVDVGSAREVQEDAAYLGELDAMQIRQNAAREAWGFKTEAIDLRMRGDIARKEGVMLAEAGRSARTSTYIAGGAQLAMGVGTLYAQRYGFGGARSPRMQGPSFNGQPVTAHT
jgi:hypothetical protein